METLLILLVPAFALAIVLLRSRLGGVDEEGSQSLARRLVIFVIVGAVLATVVAATSGGTLPFAQMLLVYLGFGTFPVLGVFAGASTSMARDSLVYWFLFVPLGGFFGVSLAFWVPMALGLEH